MYPTLLRIGGFQVTSFGAMVAVGALLGSWILRREALARGLPAAAADVGLWGVFGGLVAATLLYVASFPHGVPPTLERVHPTQLYEALLLAGLVAVLGRWRRRGVSDARILAAYFGLAGAGRFAIEFLRLNARVALGLSVAQWAPSVLVLASTVLAARQRAPAADSGRSVPPATRGVG